MSDVEEDPELERCATHLNYEISMLVKLPAWVARFDREGPAILRVACLEALLVHARVLIEFLVGRQRPATDITPSTFHWEPGDTGDLGSYLPRIDKHLAHLTRERASLATSPPWPVDEMVAQIVGALRPFVTSLNDAGSPYATLIGNAMIDSPDPSGSGNRSSLVATTTSPNQPAVVTGLDWTPGPTE